MKTVSVLCFLLLSHTLTAQEDRFAKALDTIAVRLEYFVENDTIYHSSKPTQTLALRIQTCYNTQGRTPQVREEELAQYNDSAKHLFDEVTLVRTADLKSPNHENHVYPHFSFTEWTLSSELAATELLNTLNSYRPAYIAQCAEKGGLIWWQVRDKIYLISSRAYYMTFRYDTLKAVIDKALQSP